MYDVNLCQQEHLSHCTVCKNENILSIPLYESCYNNFSQVKFFNNKFYDYHFVFAHYSK